MRTHWLLLPMHFFVCLFALGSWVGVQASFLPGQALPTQQAILLACAVYLLLAHGTLSWRLVYGVMAVLVLMATVNALLLISQYSTLDIPSIPKFIHQLGIYTAFYPNLAFYPGHHNTIPTFLAGAVPLAVGLLRTRRRWPLRLLWAVCLLICLYAIVLTFSRGALVALAGAGLIAVLVLARQTALRLLALCAIVAGVGFVLLSGSSSSWLTERLLLYRNGLLLIGDYPFTGIGLGDTFPVVYSRYGLLLRVPYIGYAHNLYLSAWLGQGMLGFIGLVGLVLAFYNVVRHIVQQGHPRRAFHALWLAVTVLLIHGLFDSRYYVDALWLMPYLFGLIGLTLGSARLAYTPNYESTAPTSKLRWLPGLMLAGSIAILAALLLFNRAILSTAWQTNLGTLAETQAELDDTLRQETRDQLNAIAQAHYTAALTTAPTWPSTNRRLGYLLLKTEDYAQAIPLLEAAYQAQPFHPAGLKALGLAYVWDGQTTTAANLFLTAPNAPDMAEELTVWAYWRSTENQPLLSAYAYETAALMNPEEVNAPLWEAITAQYVAATAPESAQPWQQKLQQMNDADSN